MVPRFLTLLVCLFCAGCASVVSQTATTGDSTSALPTSANLGDKDIVAIAVPSGQCCKRQTLPEFLGLDQLGAGVGGIFQRVFSRIQTGLGLEGKFPGLQPMPPLKSITDPANLGDDASPAVKGAAKVKAEQDKAAQKIQAMRYLATIGCGGCYPEVEKSLLSALDDCTESVRYEALKALRGKKGNSCCFCNQEGCCSANVQKKLREITTKLTPSGAYVERSERVRRLARVVLNACPPVASDRSVPDEGPSLESLPPSAAAQIPSIGSTESGVQLSNFEFPVPSDRNLCVASVNGEKIFSREFNHDKVLDRDRLYQEIHQRIARQQFMKENPAYFVWSDSLLPQFSAWLGRKGLYHPTTILDIQTYYKNNSSQYSEPASVRWEAVFVTGYRANERNALQRELEAFRANMNSNRSVAPISIGRASTKIFQWSQPKDIQSSQLRDAVFETPVGVTSGIVEIGDQMILVRVLARKDQKPKPIQQVQDAIRKKLNESRLQDAIHSLYDSVKPQFQVWTIYDQLNDDSNQVGASAANSNVIEQVAPAEFGIEFHSVEFDPGEFKP